MEAKVQKWGNSLGIRIPGPVSKQHGLKNGSVVEIQEGDDGAIVIRPANKPTLDGLLDGVTVDNLHSPAPWGGTEGNEIW